ncbi:hypothetical protein GY21_04700 [Cryobacterium roopkundense]|uniref:Putative membrane protein n=1 Tax=Cryobacterium roopkundense TaxID=1001240 RepID=A0A099JQF5_9MICO|nr:SHOCT domain-containing protein [Cryobacterium roopkundense]KGJ79633.1 hypothetical protein GY21_04700 [Cryobacterium roopkundense]MBB5639785.1 putative membrane protein [Cryobacterium roopkundense]
MMWGLGTMGWSWVFGLLAIAGLAVIMYVVVRLLANTGAPPPSVPNSPEPTGARRILDERFARGELTAEQYRDHLRMLDEGR